MLQLICDQLQAEAAAEPATAVEAGQMPSATLSAAEEIKQFKELMDAGIITAEEFEAKKKQLLGL
ncbi:SHOCT domain-containing protein [Acetobacterium wieringae]|uniref:SHOCT domain-containing protein n=1 Tax=Acetobacterium wieringae TaxID=52694 RepID=A0A5D0WRE5_9FIRM|nr:SHOCT domain-containing protein [Acetobacterium wieringae]TYC86368.1 SHOCT domain-containing protein [Acetobacterium wieringae]